MSGEWREVRRRGVGRPSSESHPVRQSYFPSRRFNPKPQSVGRWNGSYAEKDQSSVFRRECSNFDTFFFNNFPEGCWAETLRRRFSLVGKVVDVFCPKKRDIKGKPFGFVRFEKGSDQEGVLSELNNIWIGSYKLRAYVPRYARAERGNPQEAYEGDCRDKGKDDRKSDGEARKAKSYQIPESRREAGRTFLDSLAGKPKQNPQGSEVEVFEEEIEFQSTNEEKEWLQNSFTGFIKNDFVWDEVKDEIISECEALIKVTTLGGSLVLIQSQSQAPIQGILKELDEWVSFWFEWVRPWEYIDVNLQRMVWTRWWGVPLQAWNSRFFELIGSKMGMVLKIHEDTKNRNRLDAALVQISTGLKPTEKILECKIDGAQFKIRIEECGDQIPTSNEELGGASSDSDFGMDEEDIERVSTLPAEAQIGAGDEELEPSTGGPDSNMGNPSIAAHSSAVFPTPEDDLSRRESSQSLDRQEPFLASHAHLGSEDPQGRLPRYAGGILIWVINWLTLILKMLDRFRILDRIKVSRQFWALGQGC